MTELLSNLAQCLWWELNKKQFNPDHVGAKAPIMREMNKCLKCAADETFVAEVLARRLGNKSFFRASTQYTLRLNFFHVSFYAFKITISAKVAEREVVRKNTQIKL